MADFQGIFAPLTTPFDPVTGEADVIALRRNVRTYLRTALRGLVLFGSTGEGVTLDEPERARMLAAVRELVGDGVLLMAGAGAESTRGAVRLVRSAAEAGADAVLVPPPSYYRPQLTPEALRDHYVEVADASPVPVLLYQVPPAYTSVELAAGLVGELARHPRIAGIKDSSGDLRTLGDLTALAGEEFVVLAGNGSMLYAGLEMGTAGGIVAVAALAPELATELYDRWRAEDGTGAGAVQERLGPLHRAIVGKLGVPGIKAALDLLGMTGGPPRPPVKPLRPKDRALVREALQRAGLLDGPAPVV